jgi:hypothetical protein
MDGWREELCNDKQDELVLGIYFVEGFIKVSPVLYFSSISNISDPS